LSKKQLFKMAYKNYRDVSVEIKSRIQEAQLKTVMAANSQMLLLCWPIAITQWITRRLKVREQKLLKIYQQI
jgi:hypothetical protein